MKGKERKGKERKGKERDYKKSQKRYISPIRGEARCEQILTIFLYIRRYAGRNHLYEFWCRKIEGFGKYGGSKFGLSH